MSVTPETTHEGWRDRLGERVGAFVDRIDPPADVRHVSTFPEFEDLSRRAHAREVRADLLIEETRDGIFLGVTFASWRGQDADKVVLKLPLWEFKGSLEESQGQNMQTRLALTVDDELVVLSGLLPRAHYGMRLLVRRSDGFSRSVGFDPDARNRLRDEAKRRGLQPLTPIDPGLASSLQLTSAS